MTSSGVLTLTEPGPEQEPETNELLHSAWKLSHWRWQQKRAVRIVLKCTLVPHCFGTGLGPAQCEYTIRELLGSERIDKHISRPSTTGN